MKYKRNLVVSSPEKPDLRIQAADRAFLCFSFICPTCRQPIRSDLVNCFMLDYVVSTEPWFWEYVCRCGSCATDEIAAAARGHFEKLKNTHPALARQVLDFFGPETPSASAVAIGPERPLTTA